VRKNSLIEKIWDKILYLCRLTNDPVVKVYNGYGNRDVAIIYGHVFLLSPLPRKKYRQNFITNLFALLRLFMVKTARSAKVSFNWNGEVHHATVSGDGFFKFEWNPGSDFTAGWHKVEVVLEELNRKPKAGIIGKGLVFIPDEHQYACVSDIDDTFLISHSSNLRKRLYVLLTENAHSRKPFDGVVHHYQLLSKAGATINVPNPFFYVSSSEWNLYNYISEFSRKNELPDGIYLLGQLKTFKQVFKTGQNNHSTKFMRIARIIEAFPMQHFILLGDDSQMDPAIYDSIVQHFPDQIKYVYLRHVSKKNHEQVKDIVKKINDAGVACCYFTHSRDAINHSRETGLIGMVET
jgi:phosphatidate phosphatase APP1